MRCVVCGREAAAGDYCQLHNKAHKNLVKNYIRWKRASDVTWKEYLSEVVMNPLTGHWAKEVAQYLTKIGEQIDVKKC
jgi:hypothetical protein